MSNADAIDKCATIPIREVTAVEIIEWLNEHLALYAGECLALRKELAQRDRKIELLLKASGNPEAAE